MGHFAHDTGEGSNSVHHREPDGDLIWQTRKDCMLLTELIKAKETTSA